MGIKLWLGDVYVSCAALAVAAGMRRKGILTKDNAIDCKFKMIFLLVNVILLRERMVVAIGSGCKRRESAF